ncbi:MAG: aldo/keto reductase [Planctomycetaceae bacterium]|nr:aldo/keto reductase [Planctomycetaceae bacterium]
MQLRRLGQSDLWITPVAMGCWPIAGITSVDVTEAESLATLRAAFDAGINFFDTAYAYGFEGESERMIGRVLADQREDVIIASKCGIHWEQGKQVKDARPDTIRREFEESLRRLGTDYIDLYYLHAPDPQTPISDSAGALRELLEAGSVRAVGVSNFHQVEWMDEFQAVCPITASQPHYNILQRDIEADRLPWCRAHEVSVVVYWPLMKGFLAGKLPRNHQWDPKDGRQKYPVFQGEQWERTHDFLDRLKVLAAQVSCSVAQLVIAWTIRQPGITAALCGAKRPAQIQETAEAMHIVLDENVMQGIAEAIAARGEVDNRSAV